MSFLSIYTLFSDLQFILNKQWKIPYNFVLQKSPAVFSRNENAAESSQHTCPSGLMWDLTREVLSFVSLSQAYAPQSSMIPKSLPKWFNSGQYIIFGFGQRQPPVQNVTISARSWLLGTLLNSLKKKNDRSIVVYNLLFQVHSKVHGFTYTHCVLDSFLTQVITLCYTVGPCWLSILYIAVCICQSQSPSFHLSLIPRFNRKFVFHTCDSYFCFVNKFICTIFHFPVLDM